MQGLIGTTGAFAGDASVTYSFEYFGTGGAIPIDIAYNMGINLGGGSFNGQASIGLVLNGSGLGGFELGNTCGCQILSQYSGVLQNTINANQVYQISMDAGFFGAAGVGTGSTGFAFVDPIISIDSSFAGNPNS